MTPIEAFNVVASELVGMPVAHVWRGYGSAMFIEFGVLAPRPGKSDTSGHTEGLVSLGVEWSWRIEDQRAIRCGSWSEEDLWESAFDLLREARVARCELFGALPEVVITTETGIRFLSFATTDGQPRWHLIDRRGEGDRWFTVRDGQLRIGNGAEPAVA